MPRRPPHPRRTIRAAAATLLVASLLTGCANPDDAVGFDEADPHARLRAVQQAAARDDRSSIPAIITLLDSDDPAERLLAIRSLESMTGQTLGYDHAAPRDQRREASARWAAWYAHQQKQGDGGPPSPPAPPGQHGDRPADR